MSKKRIMTDYQDSEEYRNKIQKIEKIKSVLTKWNPLGENANNIKDLDNYNTEANDIYFHIVTEIHFAKSNNPLKRTQIIIKEVLNEAFNLWLSDKDCQDSAIKIMNILKKI